MENQIVSNNQQESKVYKNPKRGSIFFIGAFFFFFFSFFASQCSESPRYGSTGVQLATGDVINAMHKSSGTSYNGYTGYLDSPSSMWALIALLCTLAGMPAAVLYNKKAAFLSYWAGIVGAASLIILPIHLYFKYKADFNPVRFEYGYFAALGCLIAAAYFCYKRYNEIFNVKNNGN